LRADQGNEEIGDNPFATREIAKRLLSFPICEVFRRVPESGLLGALDGLDRSFTDELNRLFEEDEELRIKVADLLLDISWVAARALAEEGADAGGAVVSDELLARGRELGAEIQSRTKDNALVAAIADAVGRSAELRGVAVQELLPTLAR
jgi:hypothetical protein